MEDSNTFEWAIPAMTAKLKFPKGRAVQSPEFKIAGLKEPVRFHASSKELYLRKVKPHWKRWVDGLVYD